MIKNKAVKLTVAFVVLSLMLLNISTFISQFHGQQQTPTKVEFFVPITSDPNEFISVWDTTKAGVSEIDQVRLPLEWNGTYSFVVNWGDGSNDTITNWNQAEVTHTYASTGVYTITITGTIVGWRFNNGGDRLKILEIQQWGDLRLGNSGAYFGGCTNLVHTATDNLDLTGTTYLYEAFRSCPNLGSSGNMNGWDTSGVTSMQDMFYGCSSFNQPIGNWDVSSVIDMNSMFDHASSFNQPIGDWDVSSVKTMDCMFYFASLFNQPIGDWDVSCVINMWFTFRGASSFNQPIGDWDVSSVIDMWGMFCWGSSFNQPIGTWNVSRVTSMAEMFRGASSFNQPIDDWDVSSVRIMREMFSYAALFNQPIGDWNVSNVEDMDNMFSGASSFNQPIGDWNVSNVEDMDSMFLGAFSFNQPIGNWNVSRVTNMNMMFYGVTLSTSNYDNLLLGWSQLTLQKDVHFDAGYSKYSSAAEDARQTIINNFGWVITDGGLASLTSPVIPSYNFVFFLAALCVTIALVMRKRMM